MVPTRSMRQLSVSTVSPGYSKNSFCFQAAGRKGESPGCTRELMKEALHPPEDRGVPGGGRVGARGQTGAASGSGAAGWLTPPMFLLF